MASATVNNRVGLPRGILFNGVDAAGTMTARINAGFDNILRSSPDGLQVPLKDKEVQFVRGTVVTQDWVKAILLLLGTIGSYVCYELKSGAAEPTNFIKHTIINPIIHRLALIFTNKGYAICGFDYECRAADPTKGIADMWVPTDNQAAPTYVAAARGGFRIISYLHGAQAVYHLMRYNFNLTMPLVKACNDGDVGYTCVDARLDGLTADGSIVFQDSAIATATLISQKLLAAARATDVLTVKQGQAAVNKVITVAGVDFNNIDSNSDVGAEFTEHTANFDVTNNTTTQLTLAGANKIITIADAA